MPALPVPHLLLGGVAAWFVFGFAHSFRLAKHVLRAVTTNALDRIAFEDLQDFAVLIVSDVLDRLRTSKIGYVAFGQVGAVAMGADDQINHPVGNGLHGGGSILYPRPERIGVGV